MKDLIAALEAAPKGSRELDCGIARAIGWHRVEPRFTRGKYGAWIAPEDFNGTDSSGAPILDSLHGTDMHRDPPRFSTSLDAALTLVPEGRRWDVQQDRTAAFASVDGNTTDRVATPALALCIAALKSRQTMEAV